MTIKIKAPRMWQYPNGMVLKESRWFGEWRVRIVRESDWHKLMALVKAVECPDTNTSIREALEALEKKK
jgi:hypothetical protein